MSPPVQPASPESVVPAVDAASPAVREFDDFYRGISALGADPATTIEQLRDGFSRWGDFGRDPERVDYVHVDAGGVPALWAVPEGAALDRVLVCSHGGGYACGSIYSHRKLYAHLARAVGCRALLVDYRLAPEHVHPAQVEDLVAVYRWLLEDQAIAAGRIALTGDSAGGALCLSPLLRARELGLPMPAAILPLSPWIELEALDPIHETNDRDLIGTRDVVISSAEVFLGPAGDPRDPLAAPIYADLHGFPPMYIQVGGCENFVADARTLARRAQEAGVEVRLDVYADMQHVFQLLAGAAPEADDAIARLAAWVRPRLGLA
ncbi:alpha/beta hydrolase [Baekduia soli]|uniref:Alpha/beta hydrolase n=1 Tax=Baekduia soli TaxID=496014 RepID=A0A5B8U9N0_9ACTN|nr:alpha/beta hydrolase [Baekduia soli]QEC49735.1 alpha/beta hydrolase [Baekduia soli]